MSEYSTEEDRIRKSMARTLKHYGNQNFWLGVATGVLLVILVLDVVVMIGALT